ncbi:transmembrane protein 56-B-like isoform X1 [Cucurbita maxima]|uniref:Transmembrane protein 56-B-like isoform X1 n=2 Tax=Cucurbita maxima TaxID=3661 RepID=A0A6J1L744_CUCMA|nr:transmembrane protein 56-B-like isoform X1 [Cucurbita maxima]
MVLTRSAREFAAIVHLPLSLAYMTFSVTDASDPSKGLQWLASVFSGIVFCKIVYTLTGILSLQSFKAYGQLSDFGKVEWNNRGFSTFHALVAASSSLYLVLLSSTFNPGSSNELLIRRTSSLSDMTLGFSIGYFLSDLAMVLWFFPALGGLEYVLHHGLSLFSIIQSLLSGQGQVYILMVLFTEITTPFVNLRWYLDNAGQKNSNLYVINGIALFFGWLVARIVLFIYFFGHMFKHFDEVKSVYPLGFYTLLAVPPMLAVMNVFWFWKIARGMIKTLKKARHSK